MRLFGPSMAFMSDACHEDIAGVFAERRRVCLCSLTVNDKCQADEADQNFSHLIDMVTRAFLFLPYIVHVQ